MNCRLLKNSDSRLAVLLARVLPANFPVGGLV
jgi:hypothetical protein